MSGLQKQKQYFTTSEIAKTCGVTKHTLFHYDEIGLLKPEFVNDKGYRFYSVKQCYTLDIINVLKKAGSSLQEIKHFFDNHNKVMFTTLIKQKQKELEAQQLQLNRMQTFLQGAVEMSETNRKERINEPLVLECEGEYFIATRLDKNNNVDHEYTKRLSEHRSYCDLHFINHEFPVTTIMSKANFEASDYYPSFVANKLMTPIVNNKVIHRPAGLYAVMDHKGSYETMKNTYAKLKQFVVDNQLSINGDVYEVDLLNYLTEKNTDNFVIRISVSVARKAGS